MQIILEFIGDIFATTHVALILIGVGAVVFFERKNPASTIAWVLVLIFLPILGFTAYLLIGSGSKIKKKKKYKRKARSDALYNNFLRKNLNIADALNFLEKNAGATRLMTYLSNEGESIYTASNEVEIFIDGNHLFEKMIDDIKLAKSHIHLLYFSVNNDSLGWKISALLTQKALQGVEVRLIYDSVGSRALTCPPMFKSLRKAGGLVECFSPIFSNTASRLRLNYRNHRKITVIDGQIGYIGGMNIGNEYLGLNKKLSPWRDTHLKIVGQSVWFLQERFLMDWAYSSSGADIESLTIEKFFPQYSRGGNLGIQIASSGPDTTGSPLKSGLLSMIYSARENVYLQTPYFAPDNSIMDALRVAAQSGVDVRLMLTTLNDHPLSQMSALGYARQTLAAGVRVFLYNGFLHAKTAVSDALICSVGTANINNRSYLFDFEINAFIYDAAFAAECEQIFLEDQKNCLELTPQWFKAKSNLTRAGYNFARLFSPLM